MTKAAARKRLPKPFGRACQDSQAPKEGDVRQRHDEDASLIAVAAPGQPGNEQ
jgi:hypothetical protein